MAARKPNKATNKSPPTSNLFTTLSEPDINLQSSEQVNLQHNLKDVLVNAGRRTRRRLDDDMFEQNATGSNTLLSELTKLFTDFEQKQNRKFECLNSNMSDILEQNKQIRDSITFMSEKYDEVLDRLQSAERENSALRKQISSLDAKINHLERNSRSALIEINNLPTLTSENKDTLTETLCDIGSAISQPTQRTDVKNIFRMKPKKDSKSPSTVVAEFNSITQKEDFLKAVRFYNKQNLNSKLSTINIQMPGPPRPIYVAESLTSYDKHLFYQGRKLQKEGKYHSCWTNHGKIYIKITSGSTPQCINTQSDFLNTSSFAI